MGKTSIEDIKGRVGARVRTMREREGMSQEQLAQAAALSRPYVGALERGEQGAGLEVLERLGRALGVSPAALVDDQVPARDDTSRAARLGRQVESLARGATAEKIELFTRVAKAFFGRARPRP